MINHYLGDDRIPTHPCSQETSQSSGYQIVSSVCNITERCLPMEAFTVDMITKDIHGIMKKKIKVKKKNMQKQIFESYMKKVVF